MADENQLLNGLGNAPLKLVNAGQVW